MTEDASRTSIKSDRMSDFLANVVITFADLTYSKPQHCAKAMAVVSALSILCERKHNEGVTFSDISNITDGMQADARARRQQMGAETNQETESVNAVFADQMELAVTINAKLADLYKRYATPNIDQSRNDKSAIQP
jgi:hypothetical protein